MKLLRLLLVVMVILNQIYFAQEYKSKFQVDFNEIKGELTSRDLFKKDFGRYDGYKIELYEGEAVNFVVYTKNFQPSMALVNSKGEIFKQSERNDKGYANIVTTIPSSGNWVLYVIGDANSFGSYILQNAIAEPNSLILDVSADFCTTLDFLLAHANAYFFLLENPSVAKQQLVKLNDSFDAFIGEDDGSYNATFYNGDEFQKVETFSKTLTDKIKFCIGKEWKMKLSDWLTIGDYKEKSVTFTENVKDRSRYIIIASHDYTGSKQKYKYNYSIEVEINRKH